MGRSLCEGHVILPSVAAYPLVWCTGGNEAVCAQITVQFLRAAMSA